MKKKMPAPLKVAEKMKDKPKAAPMAKPPKKRNVKVTNSTTNY